MAHAIEKVFKLGFRMKAGRSTKLQNIELGALNVHFYPIDEVSPKPITDPGEWLGTGRVCKSNGSFQQSIPRGRTLS